MEEAQHLHDPWLKLWIIISVIILHCPLLIENFSTSASLLNAPDLPSKVSH